MSLVFYSDTVQTVRRISADDLRSECTILDNDQEVTAWIIADVRDFVVKDAGWEVCRHDSYPSGRVPVPEIVGIRAYLNAGGHFKRALAGKGGNLLQELLSECIRGFVQTVCRTQKEHGYASSHEYYTNFRREYLNSCRLYSGTPPDDIAWSKKVYYQPAEVIFNRSNAVSISVKDSGDYIIVSHFSDSHQQLAAQLTTDANGVVTAAEGFYLRIPDHRCGENVEFVPHLVGCSLVGMKKPTLGLIVGGAKGCDHLVTMLYNASSTFTRMLKHQRHASSPEEAVL